MRGQSAKVVACSPALSCSGALACGRRCGPSAPGGRCVCAAPSQRPSSRMRALRTAGRPATYGAGPWHRTARQEVCFKTCRASCVLHERVWPHRAILHVNVARAHPRRTVLQRQHIKEALTLARSRMCAPWGARAAWRTSAWEAAVCDAAGTGAGPCIGSKRHPRRPPAVARRAVYELTAVVAHVADAGDDEGDGGAQAEGHLVAHIWVRPGTCDPVLRMSWERCAGTSSPVPAGAVLACAACIRN